MEVSKRKEPLTGFVSFLVDRGIKRSEDVRQYLVCMMNVMNVEVIAYQVGDTDLDELLHQVVIDSFEDIITGGDACMIKAIHENTIAIGRTWFKNDPRLTYYHDSNISAIYIPNISE